MGESDRTGRFTLTRRSFLKAALATGGAAAFPAVQGARGLLDGMSLASAAGAAPLTGGPYFLSQTYVSPTAGTEHKLWTTAQAICARIVPTTTNPLTGQVTSPGATEAGAVNFLDLFLSSFQSNSRTGSLDASLGQRPLPIGATAGNLATEPPIYLQGRYSGRYRAGDPTTGAPATSPTPDDFDTGGGAPFVFLALDDTETTSWLLRLYGPAPFAGTNPVMALPYAVSSAWLSQVAGTFTSTSTIPPTIPGASALRGYVDAAGVYHEGIYEQGLVAFDTWAQQNFGSPFASLLAVEQDVLLLLASNPALSAASGAGLPSLPAPLPNPVPPKPAAQLFGILALHTFQGTYGLPEYAGLSDVATNGTGAEPKSGSVWGSIGWDGDTSPLGNSIYRLGNGTPNSGYSSADTTYVGPDGKRYVVGPTTYTDPVTGTLQPQGSYVEYRPVSSPGAGDGLLATVEEIVQLFVQLAEFAIVTVTQGGGL